MTSRTRVRGNCGWSSEYEAPAEHLSANWKWKHRHDIYAETVIISHLLALYLQLGTEINISVIWFWVKFLVTPTWQVTTNHVCLVMELWWLFSLADEDVFSWAHEGRRWRNWDINLVYLWNLWLHLTTMRHCPSSASLMDKNGSCSLSLLLLNTLFSGWLPYLEEPFIFS